MLRGRIRWLFVAHAGACAWAVACAADAGDAPKNDGGALTSPIDGSVVASDAGGGAPDGKSPVGEAGDSGGEPGTDSASTLDSALGSDAPDAGAPDRETSDAAADASTCTICPLAVQYLTPATGATKDIQAHVEITNSGASAEDLTALTLRYWFTADGSPSQAFACDYALIGCGLVQAKFVAMAAPTATADHYLELSFSGGTIAAGSSSGEIQARFHDTTDAVTFTQTNDYSFNAADSVYAPWNQITLYRGGTLVWGVEP